MAMMYQFLCLYILYLTIVSGVEAEEISEKYTRRLSRSDLRVVEVQGFDTSFFEIVDKQGNVQERFQFSSPTGNEEIQKITVVRTEEKIFDVGHQENACYDACCQTGCVEYKTVEYTCTGRVCAKKGCIKTCRKCPPNCGPHAC